MNKCPLCSIKIEDKESIIYEDNKIMLVNTRDKKGHNVRVMALIKRHGKVPTFEEMSLSYLTLINYMNFKCEEWLMIGQSRHTSYPDHWHLIASDTIISKDEKMKLNDTPVVYVQSKLLHKIGSKIKNIMTKTKPTKAVFLDKDGTLVEDPHYMTDESQLKILPGAAEGIRKLREMGYKIIVITNQSVVGRGMISEDKLVEILKRMLDMFREKGALIDAVYYCPHTPEDRCACRKPGTLLFHRAIDEYNIDPLQSFTIGDLRYDIKAGSNIGSTTILIGDKDKERCAPDYNARSILEAVDIIKELDK